MTLWRPDPSEISSWTDKYFSRTKAVVSRFGDNEVTYAVFLRRPVVAATRLAVQWLDHAMAAQNAPVSIEVCFPDGQSVGAGEPLLYITGSFVALVELETLLLQKLGATCVAAYNAHAMVQELPHVAFIAMDARHCAGTEMADLMAYAAAVGSDAAKAQTPGAVGFIGNATDATAGYFGNTAGMGTMPHALIGYAGSTLRAAEMFHQTFPDLDLVVLVDYFGQEVTDALAVCRAFPALTAAGKVGFRLDTHGGRFIEGLDTQASYDVLDRNAPEALRGYRTETDLRHLIGTGVSAAAIWHLRESLDQTGFHKARIIGSSGFSPEKCRVMAIAHAPLDVIGTGSFLPSSWGETYATADVVAYDGEPRVKVGREFLLRGIAAKSTS